MDYKNGKIYAIRSHQTEQIYIGSTTQPLTKRFSTHKKATGKKTCSSKLILQYADAYIELIETYSCENRDQLNKREGEHIRANNCVNKNMAGRTKKKYENDNPEIIRKKFKKWYEQNKEKIKEKNKKYKTENAEILKQKRKEYLARPEVKEKLKQKLLSRNFADVNLG